MAGDEDDSQKTEDPTQKKLEESRDKGEVPMSKEANNFVMLLAGTIVVAAMGGTMLTDFSILFKSVLENSFQIPGGAGGITILLKDLFSETLLILLLPLIFLMVASIAGPLLQVGPMFSPKSIEPSLSKISVIAGFGRLFSMRSMVEFLKGILKICLIGVISVIILYPFMGSLDHFIGLEISSMLKEFNELFIYLMSGILFVMFVLAAMDILYQRMENMKKLRMSRQDLKDEHRQSEGDPHVKGKLRQLRMQKAQQRMIQNVPKADVIITNPTHFAIALKYDTDVNDAPVCVAKGTDELALRIREVAKEHKVSIVENKPLARALYDSVEIDEPIPVEHYKAVAEIISYVYRLKGKIK